MKFAHGVAFPDADRFMVQEMSPTGTYQLENLEAALSYVTQFTVAIDAGAHVGTWSRVMATRFEKVLSFEPSPDTFECLRWNLIQADLTNVRPIQAALGSQPGSVTMAIDAENTVRANTGARYVRPGGTIPVITVDSLALTDLGFLKLDIEGSEPMAIEGAAETLTRCRPIVLYENKWLWSRHFGLPKDVVSSLLTKLGYRFLAQVKRDAIWGPA